MAAPAGSLPPPPLNIGSGAPAAPPAAPGGRGAMFTNPNSPALVNLTQGNQPKYLETMGEDVAKFITEKQKAVSGYQDSLNAIGELRQSLLKVPSGGADATSAVASVKKFADRFGVDLSKYLPAGWDVDPTKYDIGSKAITQLASAFAASHFPTRITNNDMQIAMAATPNFGNTPEANKQLLDNLEQVTKLRMEEAKFYRQYEAQVRKGGSVPDWTILDAWENKVASMPGVSPDLKRSFLAMSSQGQTTYTQPQPTAPLGVTHVYNPATGNIDPVRR
jgi:hypothetical protein